MAEKVPRGLVRVYIVVVLNPLVVRAGSPLPAITAALGRRVLQEKHLCN